MPPKEKPQRPTLFGLLGIYAIWLGALIAILTIPSLSFLGVLAGVLVLLVWLPCWAWVNWCLVTDHLPATYASVAVSLIVIVLLGLQLHLDVGSIGYRLVQSGWLEPREVGRLNWLEFILHLGVFYSLYPLWRWLRRAFERTS